jgi:hypothetical protein
MPYRAAFHHQWRAPCRPRTSFAPPLRREAFHRPSGGNLPRHRAPAKNADRRRPAAAHPARCGSSARGAPADPTRLHACSEPRPPRPPGLSAASARRSGSPARRGPPRRSGAGRGSVSNRPSAAASSAPRSRSSGLTEAAGGRRSSSRPSRGYARRARGGRRRAARTPARAGVEADQRREVVVILDPVVAVKLVEEEPRIARRLGRVALGSTCRSRYSSDPPGAAPAHRGTSGAGRARSASARRSSGGSPSRNGGAFRPARAARRAGPCGSRGHPCAITYVPRAPLSRGAAHRTCSPLRGPPVRAPPRARGSAGASRRPSTWSAAFSPTMIEGALVFPFVTCGKIELSATRSPSTPITRALGVHHRHRIVRPPHPAGAAGMIGAFGMLPHEGVELGVALPPPARAGSRRRRRARRPAGPGSRA